MTWGDVPQAEVADPAPQREFSRGNLQEALESHARWVKTQGREGARAELRGANLGHTNLRLAVLSEANLQGVDLERALIEGARLQGADLQNARLRGADLQRASLHRANLQGADFYQANLEGAELNEANLQAANFLEVNLRHADLQRTNLQHAFLKEASLQQADLQGSNLQGANLQEADLLGADLQRTVMRDANLSGANLRGADLQSAGLQGCNLQAASLQHANLRNVDFTGCIGLVTSQLAGADVAGAKFSAEFNLFGGIDTVRELTHQARRLFFLLLCGCILAWLCITATTDARLLTNASIALFPELSIPIPSVAVFNLTPILLVLLYIYLHLYLQRLWEEMATLPAIFPDGRPLDRAVYPWLLHGLVRVYNGRLQDDRPPLSRLQMSLYTFLTRWLVPLTLLAFWLRGLPRHDWLMTLVHLNLTVIALGFAILFQSLARTVLQGNPLRRYQHGSLAIMLAGISLTILSCISFGALTGAPPHVFATFRPAELSLPTRAQVNLRRIVPQVLTFIGHSPFANLVETEVSTRRSSPSDHNELSPTIVQGAVLRQRSLRYANAVGAFLVNADLRGADLVGADLRRADLRGARLDGANLLGSNLRGADLRNVTGLTRAQIQGAITDATTRLPIVTLAPSENHPSQ